MGWGMGFMHEVLHTNVAKGGAIEHGDEKTIFSNTGIVVDRMNIIRRELNAQGENYGIRKCYQTIYFNFQAKSPAFIPFDSSSFNSLVSGNHPPSSTCLFKLNNYEKYICFNCNIFLFL